LWDLYCLSKCMLTEYRCCYIRARVKDKDRNVQRKYLGDDATLVLQDMNWFALDIDGFGESSGNLAIDMQEVLAALPRAFLRVQCFAVASASYGIKPGIRMRLFFWSDKPCSNLDLKRYLHGNKAKADLALFNPIQPIYTAAPIFVGWSDPVKERIL